MLKDRKREVFIVSILVETLVILVVLKPKQRAKKAQNLLVGVVTLSTSDALQCRGNTQHNTTTANRKTTNQASVMTLIHRYTALHKLQSIYSH